MATARSSNYVNKWAAVAAIAGVAAAVAVTLLGAYGSADGTRDGESDTMAATLPRPFSWLVPRAAPPAWRSVALRSGDATLSYPPGWKPIEGDTGTVSVALRNPRGVYRGYLNVTPREGGEHLAGWPTFRIARNREEGDTDVREIAATEDLRFGDSRVSCVIDDYRSRVGAHGYRELACILSGRRAANVFVGATARGGWKSLRPVVERAGASLLER
jgi:hypothetical protein